MSGALMVTAVTAYTLAARSNFIAYLEAHPFVLLGIFVAQIVLVIALTSMLTRLSMSVAVILFTLYAVLVGVSFSSLFAMYTTASIAATFAATAGMFGTTALYGYYTKKDLSSLGSMGTMMIFGLIIGGIINIFLKSSMMEFLIAGAGIIIFTVVTAYDMQKLKTLNQHLHADQETTSKIALLGALTLYLDFINLFLFVLRFMGNRRES